MKVFNLFDGNFDPDSFPSDSVVSDNAFDALYEKGFYPTQLCPRVKSILRDNDLEDSRYGVNVAMDLVHGVMAIC